MRALLILFVVAACLPAQQVRPKDVRDMAKGGSNAIPQLQELLKSSDISVRVEVVKQITGIGTQRSLDPLLLATQDNDPEVQIRATDGLVDFYLPGYVENGLGASLKRVGTSIRGRFTDVNDQVIDTFVMVRPDLITALGKLARGGGTMEVRANAARGLGILRGAAALPDLYEAVRSKNTEVIHESVVAIQKIGDRSAAPRISFLMQDLDPRVQLATIETTGLLQNHEALPQLAEALRRAREAKIRRAALTAIAMLPSPANRPLYEQYLRDKDEKMRAAAAEGFARLRKPEDLPMMEKAWQDEGKTSPRLSLAFAQVMLGKAEVSEFSPLQYIVNTLNSATYKGEAFPFLVELAREENVRQSLYRTLAGGTRDERIGICGVLARSGDRASVAEIEKLAKDPDTEVAAEALRAVRTLQSRI